LEHWAGRPPDIMDGADREVAALAASGLHRDTLAATLNDVVSQPGRMVAALWAGLYNLPKESNSPENEAPNG
jgi:hypothetical protein